MRTVVSKSEVNQILGAFQSGISIETLATKYDVPVSLVEAIIRHEFNKITASRLKRTGSR